MTTPTTDTPGRPAHDGPALDAALRDLSTWHGPPTRLWEAALDSAAAHRPFRLTALRPRTLALGAAAMLLLAIGAVLTVGTLTTIGRVAGPPVAMSAGERARSRDSAEMAKTDAPASPATDAPGDITERRGRSLSRSIFGPAPSSDGPSPPTSPRHIVRKATLELASPDVRAAFAKAQHALRADLGEYAESSQLTGDGPATTAQLTLRVVATRLDEALATLRALGKVTTEQSGGDDVTDRAVDLDARLRNERQVEAELLELLASRKGSPLADVLALRDKLALVRDSIERLQAQRDTLARQVALASVLVIIRSGDAPTPAPASLRDNFLNQLTSALSHGVASLTASIAWLLRTLVAGALWWPPLVIAILLTRRALRHATNPARAPSL